MSCAVSLTGLLTGCKISKGEDVKPEVELGMVVIFFSSLKDEVVLQL